MRVADEVRFGWGYSPRAICDVLEGVGYEDFSVNFRFMELIGLLLYYPRSQATLLEI